MSDSVPSLSAATPGPWKASGWSVYGADGRPLARVASCYMADVPHNADEEREWDENSRRDDEEAEANAKLIASAPSLCARVARLEKFARAVAEWKFEGDVRALALAALAGEEGR